MVDSRPTAEPFFVKINVIRSETAKVGTGERQRGIDRGKRNKRKGRGRKRGRRRQRGREREKRRECVNEESETEKEKQAATSHECNDYVEL